MLKALGASALKKDMGSESIYERGDSGVTNIHTNKILIHHDKSTTWETGQYLVYQDCLQKNDSVPLINKSGTPNFINKGSTKRCVSQEPLKVRGSNWGWKKCKVQVRWFLHAKNNKLCSDQELFGWNAWTTNTNWLLRWLICYGGPPKFDSFVAVQGPWRLFQISGAGRGHGATPARKMLRCLGKPRV